MSKYELKLSLIEQDQYQSFLSELFNFYVYSKYDLYTACEKFSNDKRYDIKNNNFFEVIIFFDSEEEMFLFIMEYS